CEIIEAVLRPLKDEDYHYELICVLLRSSSTSASCSSSTCKEISHIIKTVYSAHPSTQLAGYIIIIININFL
ncbi:unnamed protein product, partial [Amoebophrya sp. A25]